MLEDFRKIKESNWYTNFGPNEAELSKRTASFISSHVTATTVANATLGLQLAITELFKKDPLRNKVLVPSFTFAAGPELLIAAGFKLVFIDILPITWQPDHIKAEGYIKNNIQYISGIFLCNIFGVGNQEVEKWEQLSIKYKIPLIIDSAAGFGSHYTLAEKIGARGDCEVFSFHATKPFSVGEGGLVMSKNAQTISAIKSLENFGFESDRMVHRIGTNAKLQEINCAIGLRQLEGFEQRLINRRNTLESYKRILLPFGFEFQQNDNNSTVPFASILAKSKISAETLYKKLHVNGVEARRYYTPLHKQQVISLKSEIHLDLKLTEEIADRILSLPVLDNMTDKELQYVTSVIKDNI